MLIKNRLRLAILLALFLYSVLHIFCGELELLARHNILISNYHV